MPLHAPLERIFLQDGSIRARKNLQFMGASPGRATQPRAGAPSVLNTCNSRRLQFISIVDWASAMCGSTV